MNNDGENKDLDTYFDADQAAVEQAMFEHQVVEKLGVAYSDLEQVTTEQIKQCEADFLCDIFPILCTVLDAKRLEVAINRIPEESERVDLICRIPAHALKEKVAKAMYGEKLPYDIGILTREE